MKYPNPIITKTAILVSLHEPIYGSHFGIWDKWIKIAKQRNLNMIVKTPFGVATYKASSWKRGAVLKKRYYKNPNEPMLFWCRDLLPDIKAREERKKQEEQISILQPDNRGVTQKYLDAYKRSQRV